MTGKHVRVAFRACAAFVIHFFHGGLVVTGLLAAIFLVWHMEWVRGTLQFPGPSIQSPSDGLINVALETPDARASIPPDIKPVVDYVARRYRVAAEGIAPLVSTAYSAGARVGLDPLLIVAVMAIESRFNPLAESSLGAKGLMQVMPRYHQDKLAESGSASFLDPFANIEIGVRILKESIRSAGSLEDGLSRYGGVGPANDFDYAGRVIAEKQRLEAAVQRSRMSAIDERAAAERMT